jgi:hypothetical protein
MDFHHFPMDFPHFPSQKVHYPKDIIRKATAGALPPKRWDGIVDHPTYKVTDIIYYVSG